MQYADIHRGRVYPVWRLHSIRGRCLCLGRHLLRAVGSYLFVVGVQAEYNLLRLQVTQGSTRREAEYGSGLQYMSWDGWLGSMA
jgi:hypothetical protein